MLLSSLKKCIRGLLSTVVVVVVVEIFIIKILKHWAFIMKIVKRKIYVQWRLPDYMNLKKPLWHCN